MFSVADLDSTDNSVEIIASQFFGKKLTLHSIERGPKPKVNFRRVIDDRCGASFSAVLADLKSLNDKSVKLTSPAVVDCGSTANALRPGDVFSHVLVTSHECKFDDESATIDATNGSNDMMRRFGSNIKMGWETSVPATDGGSLFAYRIPKDWKTQDWTRTVIATGFRVRGQLGNMINPGAPGFVYTFYATKERGTESSKRPLIGISGDCAQAAYILRPKEDHTVQSTTSNELGQNLTIDSTTKYELMCEIECGATVGSLAIGYDDFCGLEQQSGFAKIYIPCYEKDKILVFAVGDGDEEDYDEF